MGADTLLKLIADEDAEYVDIRFTDPRGQLQHVTVMSNQVDADFIEEGFMFDGSSIAGWKSIEASDMKLMMDTESAYVDPFYAEKTVCVHCYIVEPDTGEAYNRDPRGTAMKAEAYLKSSGIGDTFFVIGDTFRRMTHWQSIESMTPLLKVMTSITIRNSDSLWQRRLHFRCIRGADENSADREMFLVYTSL